MIEDPKLTAYALGELQGDDKQEVEDWLTDNPEGQAEVQAIRDMAGLLQASLADEPEPSLDSATRARLTNHRRAWWRWAPLLAAATVLAIIIPVLLEKDLAPVRLDQPDTKRQSPSESPSPPNQAETGQATPKPAPTIVDGIEIVRGDDVPQEIRAAHQDDLRRRALGEKRKNDAAKPSGGRTAIPSDGTTERDQIASEPELEVHEEMTVVGETGPTVLDTTAVMRSYDADPAESPKPSRISEKQFVMETEEQAAGFYDQEGEIFVPTEANIRPEPQSTDDMPNTESYAPVKTNPFFDVAQEPLSTFSIDVDTASYSNVRRYLEAGQMPPRGAVRVEELLNYFDYRYPRPDPQHPFSASIDVVSAPWNPDHRLARIGIQGYEMTAKDRPSANLVFLIDVSGSMSEPNKLPLVQHALKRLSAQMRADDSISIVVYAGSSGVVLKPTSGKQKQSIASALDNLKSAGSTNGAAGIQAAYKMAQQAFISGGVNRVVLATDGDFNVGTTSRDSLLQLIEEKAKTGVFLTVLGFGMGNYQDDTLELLADKGNGFYAYIDNRAEAERVMVRRLTSSIVTIAKDVKLQLEFNPMTVSGYRLLGYENRVLEHQDFNDDSKDAGEIGAGHSVTAIYELIPAGHAHKLPDVDPLKYQTPSTTSENAMSGELFTLKIRYKQPDGDSSQKLEFVAGDDNNQLDAADQETRFAIAVAGFAMRLRGELNAEELPWSGILELAREGQGPDPYGDRAGFLKLVQRAKSLSRD